MDAERELIGKCGFYCGSCPTYAAGACAGCRSAHGVGDCFTFDCVDRQGVAYCGLCAQFPCEALFSREKATVLDRAWLAWKKHQRDGS